MSNFFRMFLNNISNNANDNIVNDSSTFNDIDGVYITQTINNVDIPIKEETYQFTSSTPQENVVNKLTEISSLAIKKMIIEEEERVKDIVSNEEIILVKYLEKFDDDIVSSSIIDEKIMSLVDTFSFKILGDVLQSIVVKYNDNTKILCGICKSLCRYDLEDVNPWGQIMLVSLLNHKAEPVKEYAVILLENWADTTFLPMLRNLDCASSWLKNYVNDVIKNLEG